MKSALCYIACLTHVSLCLPCCRWQCDVPKAVGSTERPLHASAALSFCLGAFIQPLIVDPFLMPLPVVMETNTMSLVYLTTNATPLVDNARNVRSLLGVTEYHHETSTKTSHTYLMVQAQKTWQHRWHHWLKSSLIH